jgi:hypothetical protein
MRKKLKNFMLITGPHSEDKLLSLHSYCRRQEGKNGKCVSGTVRTNTESKINHIDKNLKDFAIFNENKYRCLALKGSKIKHYIPSTTQCIGKSIHFQTMDITKYLMYSADLLIWAPLVALAHIRTIFSFWTGIGKHFIGNALCSSDDSVMLIHVLYFFMINSVLYKPLGRKSRGVRSGE